MSSVQSSIQKRTASLKSTQNASRLPLRVYLYSHDSVGLGHLRRNLAIAGEITRTFPQANVLIVTGSPCATQFRLPENTDLIKIPAISKDIRGRYVTRNYSGSLEKTLQMRAKIILETFRQFKPHLVIMDHQLLGLKGEALDMLREARENNVIIIYGLRDIKDSPDVVRSHWSSPDSRWALSECYDRICIYGEQKVFDPCAEYAPALDEAKRLDFVGYVVPRFKKASKPKAPGARKKVLAIFGGGSDGVQRVASYLQALASAPANWDSHIITGPLMDPETVRRFRNQAKRLQPIRSARVYKFHPNIPALLSRADAVVSMAGYNSCTEILQSGVPAVLLPRSFPRREQLIRAERLAELGLATVLPEADPDPEKLRAAVEAALTLSPQKHLPVNLDGLNRLCEIIAEELQFAQPVKKTAQSEG